MVTLLEMFEKAEESLPVKNLHKLKRVYDASETSGSLQMKFEMDVLFSILSSFKPKKMDVSIEHITKAKDNFEFNPTISGPNISVIDELNRSYSVWYKPLFYFPHVTSAKPTTVDFIFLEGKEDSLYSFSESLQKEFYTYEFFSYDALKEVSARILRSLKPVKLAVLARKEFRPSDLIDIKSISYYLKPKKTLLVSEEYLPEKLKLNLPPSVSYIENVDMNFQKVVESVKELF